ncbi:VOC family protein [Staphylococcus pseudintermedius]|uniref:VOC family protein n=1 Tax=Staphylococcus pseudintermedius TaxID=283734 RepID=UPI0019DA5701|nr:VOC family protein [Staphylococcus pseudintermedius]EGQ2937022.1 VOC family protein [Staphylococcus pseudintermedius]EGQ3885271.1 VOC family protein [Staphylococcus pseudintermedius]EGQ3974986.1 VOC family protein [Staphylococcus pseudintermedius]EGQ4319586.1 VOC family protein [Staphylococcus pseudintermedius]EHA6090228.1 VOC family protein [Staphylococcus pseudintermedius]
MEFYQMQLFNKLLVSDIEKTEEWYRHTLGLQSVFKFRDEENEVILNHLRLNKYQDLMLIQSEDFNSGNGCFINILVDDIETIANSISEKYVLQRLEQMPWNAMEMTIVDTDGYQITLTESNIKDGDFEKLMNSISKKY